MKAQNIKTIIAQIEAISTTRSRKLISLVGAPGSGKTTFSKQLAKAIGKKSIIVPMDGYHYSNTSLNKQKLLSRKGAPGTFDIDAFRQMTEKVYNGENCSYSTFDRIKDKVQQDSGRIESTHEIVIFEGNYLLLNLPKWKDLKQFWDISIFIDLDEDIIKTRLLQRWLELGLDLNAATERVQSNDLKNAETVICKSFKADIVIRPNEQLSINQEPII